jgi:adenine-specific DNA-methyltransferase
VSRLTDLLAQVDRLDADLAADLSAEVKVLTERRAFGLNFERHQPETVELPGRPIRRGDQVRLRDGADRRLWRVLRVADDTAELLAAGAHSDAEPERRTHPVADLTVVAGFRDPIFPGLTSTGRIERGGDRPFHAIINAENFHALRALLYTHEGAVDAIYIDPPYNTGNQSWTYNDQYVVADDVYRHSKWLAFMERRLRLARRLLKPTGVIIVAIGDDEHHRLRMLLDQVFGAGNFIADVTWQGSGSSVARHHAGGQDYMLVYAYAAELVPRFEDPKPLAPEMLAIVARALAGGASPAQAQQRLRQFIRAHRREIAAGLAGFNSVDEQGRVFDTADITNRLHRPNLKYDVVDPATGRVFAPPANGWTLSRELMTAYIEDGLICFDGSMPRKKKLLTDYLHEMPLPTFSRARAGASQHLAGILGDKRFPFPKDHEVLMRWLRMVAPADGVILDFFGGSGSTAEAVMRLNEQDGGTRQCLLVTNNEVAAADARRLHQAGHRRGDRPWEARGVYEYVARPRLSTVLTGIRPDGSAYSEGLRQNLEFLTLTYQAPRPVAHHRSFRALAPLLWLRAGARGRCIAEPNGAFDVAEAYGVLFSVDAVADFVAALGEDARIAYVVTDDERAFQLVCAELPEHVAPVRLYESYLATFAMEVEA